MIDKFSSVGDMKTATKLFSEMIGLGLSPNNLTYTTLIYGFHNK